MAASLHTKLIRPALWTASTLVGIPLVLWLFILVFGWNWLRAPLERLALRETGRTLVIEGDLTVKLGWPLTPLHAQSVRFSNPAWAEEPQMLRAEGVSVVLDLGALLHGDWTFTEVRLEQAEVFLERNARGQKTWLLDLRQTNEAARIHIGRIAVDHGLLGYDDASANTHLRAELSTDPTPGTSGTSSTEGSATELKWTASGQFKGLAVLAHGSGGPVLALRDTAKPYPFILDASIGSTVMHVAGIVTGLLELSQVNVGLDLRGDSLEQLYPLLGMSFPRTPRYVLSGHLTHSGTTWRLDSATGTVGHSDLSGFAQVVTGGVRPQLSVKLNSQRLSLDDLAACRTQKFKNLTNLIFA